MLKSIKTTIMAAGALALCASASAQVNSDSQPASSPQMASSIGFPGSVAPQASGGNGASILWAFVAADGTHTSDGGQGLNTSAKISTGQYEVIFKRDIGSYCSYMGGMSKQASFTDHGHITVVKRGGNSKGVFVSTYDVAGAQADRDFAVFITCYL